MGGLWPRSIARIYVVDSSIAYGICTVWVKRLALSGHLPAAVRVILKIFLGLLTY